MTGLGVQRSPPSEFVNNATIVNEAADNVQQTVRKMWEARNSRSTSGAFAPFVLDVTCVFAMMELFDVVQLSKL